MGDRGDNIAAARELIAMRVGRVTAASAVGESEPWGDVVGVENKEYPSGAADASNVNGAVNSGESGNVAPFLNQVLVVETRLTPYTLLDEIQAIEKSLGRVRGHKSKQGYAGSTQIESDHCRTYSSRTMDIDILFYDDMEMADGRLTIPHPHIRERAFVLRPLAEIMPEYVHPAYGQSVAELLKKF